MTTHTPGARAELVWITNPDNYDPGLGARLKREGSERVDLYVEHGFDVRVVHSCDVVPGWNSGPRLWHGDEDLLCKGRGFLLSSWTWHQGIAQQIQAIARTIRASDAVLLTDGVHGAEGLAMDKLAMYHHAGRLDVPVLPCVAVPFGRYTRRALETVRRELAADAPHGYVIKPREMAMGFGVHRVDTLEQLSSALDLLAPADLGCLVQPCLPHTGDVRVYVHQGRQLAALLRTPEAGAYRANVSQGGSGSALTVPAEITEMSERLARSVDADYLCVDWLLGADGPVFNEWMTVSAAFEDLPEPERSTVGRALVTHLARRLGVGGTEA
ncbi:hypothetical protein [Streptomyces sp. NPDC046197]|uniref:ATP-grasp domain-containing protein n=1 Tax=Streptomyces sp. NPDC046197 TaxID=3154337 RepID=UPI0033FA51D8